jgi:Tol biopolymer transport system component
VARPDIRFPEWFAPSGYRVAYLSAGSLRVIAGDGTDDRQLAAHVALVAPAWRSGHPYQLAYALANGSVVLRDADSTLIAWSRHVPGRVRLLAWSANGRRLLVLSTKGAFVFDGAGRRLGHIATGAPLDGALSPDGNQLALLSHEDVVVIDLKAKSPAARRLFTGDGLRQLTWSPDGRWLLVTWPAANQWVFVHARGRPRIIAVSNIARQFGSRRRFPSLEGWCCT